MKLTWSVGFSFEDGGGGAGSFDYVAATKEVSNVNISVGGGGQLFPFYSYFNLLEITNLGNPQDTFIFQAPGNPSGARQLRITPEFPLTDAGGSIPINTETVSGLGSVECFNCTPSRLITIGFLLGQGGP